MMYRHCKYFALMVFLHIFFSFLSFFFFFLNNVRRDSAVATSFSSLNNTADMFWSIESTTLFQNIPGLMKVVYDASKWSLVACQDELKKRRWNCSRTPDPYPAKLNGIPAPYFGRFLELGKFVSQSVRVVTFPCVYEDEKFANGKN